MSADLHAPVVALTVPCAPEYLGLIRLVASSVATNAGMDVDDIDDLRIAADELCYLLMSATADELDMKLTFTLGPQRVVIDGERAGWPEGGVLPGASDLMVKILAQVIDDFEISGDGGSVRFRAVKDTSSSSKARTV